MFLPQTPHAGHRGGNPAARQQCRRGTGGTGVALGRFRTRHPRGRLVLRARRPPRSGVEHARRTARLGEGSGPDHRARGRPVQPLLLLPALLTEPERLHVEWTNYLDAASGCRSGGVAAATCITSRPSCAPGCSTRYAELPPRIPALAQATGVALPSITPVCIRSTLVSH